MATKTLERRASPTPPGQPTRRVPEPRRPPAILVGPVIVAVVAAAMAFGVKFAYGGYGNYYTVSMKLPRASQLLEPGSDVRESGVVIGHVQSIALTGRDVTMKLQIVRQYSVPKSAQAFVDLKTLLGAKFVDLRYQHYAPPFLHDGDKIVSAHVGPELEDALQDGVQVLDAIRPNDLATVVGTLAEAARGHGDDIARGLVANDQLSALFARTLEPQLRSLHDFDVVFGALKDKGVDLNRLAAAINSGVPVYASAQAQKDLDKALRALQPFSTNLADLLILNKSDWDTMLDSGDVVLGNIAARPGGLHDLVQGLYRYVFKLGQPPCTTVCGLTDGSAAAGFTNFIGGDSSQQNQEMICWALPLQLRPLIPFCKGVPPPPSSSGSKAGVGP
jgi:virulence factor Mce-like protein